ncbi:hypothetical protein AXG93_40s1010 [Marchantia polymorpha subsp. ruderalis]|uniref:Uncharacterized protein n=1 Tax=Marchantia polymorpha subsp. ruderalis TaxID=1480154 RepID=A0A176WEL3_MARPO|nr:hypothetical protein AXG93_40s1010 [Marchantia polymorpha subsp. ruderalis]
MILRGRRKALLKLNAGADHGTRLSVGQRLSNTENPDRMNQLPSSCTPCEQQLGLASERASDLAHDICNSSVARTPSLLGPFLGASWCSRSHRSAARCGETLRGTENRREEQQTRERKGSDEQERDGRQGSTSGPGIKRSRTLSQNAPADHLVEKRGEERSREQQGGRWPP